MPLRHLQLLKYKSLLREQFCRQIRAHRSHRNSCQVDGTAKHLSANLAATPAWGSFRRKIGTAALDQITTDALEDQPVDRLENAARLLQLTRLQHVELRIDRHTAAPPF